LSLHSHLFSDPTRLSLNAKTLGEPELPAQIIWFPVSETTLSGNLS